jgi:hypothetical protein
MIQAAVYPAVLLVTLTSIALLISSNWRWVVLILAAQYTGVFILVAVEWPIEMAAAKIVAGWMASAVLGVTVNEAFSSDSTSWQVTDTYWPSGRLFRLLAAGLVIPTVLSATPQLVEWMGGIGELQAAGALTLIGMGLLHLGLTAQPLRVVIGLLTVLSGFEIILATIQVSALVAGLLAFVNLGLALVGAYLMLAPSMQETA